MLISKEKYINLIFFIMKNIFTLMLAFMAVGTLSAQSTWNDYAADSYAGGSGTYDDPYLISTPEQLAKMSKDCDEGNAYFDEETYDQVCFKLTNDIDLDGHNWEPVGGANRGGKFMGGNAIFNGIFDGAGYSIKNMNIDKSDAFESGLFNHIGDYGEVGNFVIESGKVYGEAGVAAVAAYCSGTIKNCTNKVNVTARLTTSMSSIAAGICGTVAATEYGNPANITDCVNYGNVRAGENNGWVAGGIVAVIEGNCNVLRCANLGDVTTFQAQAGGIVAYITTACIIRDCYNRGVISAGQQTGGIVGQAGAKNDRVYITNCYNAATLKGSNGSGYPTGKRGSIVAAADGLKYIMVDSCYNDADLNNPAFGDYIIDDANSSSRGGMCLGGDEVKAFTTEMMANNMDFAMRLNSSSNGVWVMDTENINDGYPVLRIQNSTAPSLPTSVESIAAENIVTYAVDGKIVVEGFYENVYVYDINGRIVYLGTSGDLDSKTFENGVYVVYVNGVAQKIVVE